MDLISFVAGLIIGLVAGAGGALYYIKYKMNQQLGMMEEQMNEMMEATEGLAEDFGDIEGMDRDQAIEDFEAAEKPEDHREEDSGEEDGKTN